MSDEPLFWLIAGPLGLAAFFYLGAPILIRFATAQNADARPEPFDPEENPPPESVARFWDDTEAALAPHGFAREAHLSISDLVPNVQMLIAVFGDRVTDTAAVAAFAVGRGPDGSVTEAQRIVNTANQFRSPDSPHGTLEVSVVNSADAMTFPRPPEAAKKLLCQWLSDPADLLRVQREAAREWGGNLKRDPLPPPDRWAEQIAAGMAEEFADYTSLGWFGPPREGRRMMTWWGAYRATWKQLPPIKQVLKAVRASRAKATLRSWGLDELC